MIVQCFAQKHVRCVSLVSSYKVHGRRFNFIQRDLLPIASYRFNNYTSFQVRITEQILEQQTYCPLTQE